ncbi:hypothetical protein B0H34DRAFT_797644 [Crassisporium funariophilum]|nr:hypothetical protein B0H34DRAFT_797644 [Crassisporium funariophilum]
MKRSNLTLVSYASSDDEDKSDHATSMEPIEPPPSKKRHVAQSFKYQHSVFILSSSSRKLPPISSSIIAPGPIDNPALHQGRTRTRPHVEGQFAAHVYVSLALSRQSLLYRLLQDIFVDAKKTVPTLLEISPAQDSPQRPELHISISRPIFLRAHQREDLKRAVKKLAKAQKPFTVSFATLSELINDEKTRTFLTIEVGAGHHELRSLADALAPALRAIRQQEYYDKPRFHASIAWALLNRPKDTSNSSPVTSDSNCSPRAPAEDPPVSSSDFTPGAMTPEPFPTISHLPCELITSLNECYSARLSSPRVGAFDVEEITMKIGKEICSFRLLGM